MPSPRLKVEKQTDRYVIRVIDHTADTLAKLQEVFTKINEAASLPDPKRHGSDYHDLFNEGPLLFDEQAIDPATRRSVTQLGGLQVSERKLAATLAKLRELGFDVIQ
jgi:hypothetical protein